jgi:hypothetical protein
MLTGNGKLVQKRKQTTDVVHQNKRKERRFVEYEEKTFLRQAPSIELAFGTEMKDV